MPAQGLSGMPQSKKKKYLTYGHRRIKSVGVQFISTIMNLYFCIFYHLSKLTRNRYSKAMLATPVYFVWSISLLSDVRNQGMERFNWVSWTKEIMFFSSNNFSGLPIYTHICVNRDGWGWGGFRLRIWTAPHQDEFICDIHSTTSR